MHPKTFIHQLYAILQESRLQEWISWSEEDDSVFVVKSHDAGFSQHVLRRYFKHGNVSSFVRQLHMYGFHKISNAQEGGDEGRGGDEGADRASTRWYFVHPLGHFRKNADVASLKKIQRKSAGVGKDGKRKNVLSTVCVNYVGSEGQEPAAPLADRRHYASLPLLPATGPVMAKQEPQYEQPLLPHIHCPEHLISKSRTISSPELISRPGSKNVPSSGATPLPMAHFRRVSSPLQAQANGPLPTPRSYVPGGPYITPTSSAVSSTSTKASLSMIEYHQRLENNLRTLRNSLMTVADIMPSLFVKGSNGPPTEERRNYDDYINTLQRLKEDLIAENNLSRIRSLQSSFAGPSTSASFPIHIASKDIPPANHSTIITPTTEAQVVFKPKLPDDADKADGITYNSKEFTAQ